MKCLSAGASLFYLHHPNECFQLVNVKLEIHPVGQPGADDIHGAVVPLLKERQKFSRQHVTEGRQLREGTGHICTPALLQRKQDGQTESEGTEDHDRQVTQMRCWFSLDQGNVGWGLNLGPSDYTQHIHGAFLKTVSGALGSRLNRSISLRSDSRLCSIPQCHCLEGQKRDRGALTGTYLRKRAPACAILRARWEAWEIEGWVFTTIRPTGVFVIWTAKEDFSLRAKLFWAVFMCPALAVQSVLILAQKNYGI